MIAIVRTLPGKSSDNPANSVHPTRDSEQLQEEVENASTTLQPIEALLSIATPL